MAKNKDNKKSKKPAFFNDQLGENKSEFAEDLTANKNLKKNNKSK